MLALVLAGGEELPLAAVVGLRLTLDLSDAQYTLLHRALPGWLPPLRKLWDFEAETAGKPAIIMDADGN